MDAAKNGDVSKVVDMVVAGMPVDIDDGNGWTALRRAVISNQTDVVRYLLNNGGKTSGKTFEIYIVEQRCERE